MEFYSIEKHNRKKLKLGMEKDICMYLYNFIVKNKIKSVVETGINHGYSSAYILLALRKTDGHLWSVEPKLKKNLVVPMELRNQWTIIHDKSPDALPALFSHIGRVDLFWHDSLHNFATQFSEYIFGLRYAKYIGSHDIGHTKAWDNFLKLFRCEVIARGKKHGLVENKYFRSS